MAEPPPCPSRSVTLTVDEATIVVGLLAWIDRTDAPEIVALAERTQAWLSERVNESMAKEDRT